MKIALRIEVQTLRGLREGVPRLVEALSRHGAGASFFFNLGPERSGRALFSIIGSRGGIGVFSRYSLASLLRGTLLPAADLGRRAPDTMRAVVAAGFEAGVLSWDAVTWRRRIAAADNAWVELRMALATSRYREIFGTEPAGHAAPGWRMNRHALRLTQRFGYSYASDCRGSQPFIPIWNGEIVACPQLPTTLPTLDELLPSKKTDLNEVIAHYGRLPETAAGHVHTLRAEVEGGRFLPLLERVIADWREQGHEILSLRDLAAGLDSGALPRHEIGVDEKGILRQGKTFLA